MIKGSGMTLEQKKIARKKNVSKYNSKPSTRERVRAWHLQHADRVREIKEKYANSQAGKEHRKVCGQGRLALEKQLTKQINWDYWQWLCQRLGYRCQMCQQVFDYSELTVDHQIPIKLGGDNDEWNLQPLCRSCNCSKQDRLIAVDNVILDIAYGDWLCQKL